MLLYLERFRMKKDLFYSAQAHARVWPASVHPWMTRLENALAEKRTIQTHLNMKNVCVTLHKINNYSIKFCN